MLAPYLKNTQILRCPSNRDWLTRASDYGWNYQEFGYWYDDHGTGWCTGLSQIDAPASTVLLGDSARPTSLYKRHTTYTSKVHNGGGNGLCDGHAKWYSYQTMRKSKSQGAPWRC